MKRNLQEIIDSPEVEFAATYGTAVSLVQPKRLSARLSRPLAVPGIGSPPDHYGHYPVSQVEERVHGRGAHVENRPSRYIVLLCLDLESGTLTTQFRQEMKAMSKTPGAAYGSGRTSS